MRAVDTNVLIRLLVRDDPRQTEAAEAFIVGGAWVSHVVLAETCWVLSSVYNRKPAYISQAVDLLLKHAQLAVQDGEVVEAALTAFREMSKIGFPDHLIVAIARKAGHTPVGTFDANLSRLENVQRL